MYRFFSLLALLLLLLGCRKPTEPFVLEENTPMVAAGLTTESFGIETMGGAFTPLIPAGSKVPSTFAKIFSTTTDGQTELMISPVRGTNDLVADNHSLGRFQLVGIPSARRGAPKIEVLFIITDRQVLLSAREVTHNKELRVERLK